MAVVNKYYCISNFNYVKGGVNFSYRASLNYEFAKEKIKDEKLLVTHYEGSYVLNTFEISCAEFDIYFIPFIESKAFFKDAKKGDVFVVKDNSSRDFYSSNRKNNDKYFFYGGLLEKKYKARIHFGYLVEVTNIRKFDLEFGTDVDNFNPQGCSVSICFFGDINRTLNSSLRPYGVEECSSKLDLDDLSEDSPTLKVFNFISNLCSIQYYDDALDNQLTNLFRGEPNFGKTLPIDHLELSLLLFEMFRTKMYEKGVEKLFDDQDSEYDSKTFHYTRVEEVKRWLNINKNKIEPIQITKDSFASCGRGMFSEWTVFYKNKKANEDFMLQS